MNRRRLIALISAAMCALPVAALAQPTGGTQFGDPAATQPTALPAQDAILLGRTMHVRGTLSGAAGQTVVVERREGDGDWQQTATAIAGDDDSFDASWTSIWAVPLNCGSPSMYQYRACVSMSSLTGGIPRSPSGGRHRPRRW